MVAIIAPLGTVNMDPARCAVKLRSTEYHVHVVPEFLADRDCCCPDRPQARPPNMYDWGSSTSESSSVAVSRDANTVLQSI